MPEGVGLTGYSFTATPPEDAAICMLLKESGFEPDSKGLKAFLLHATGIAPGDDSEEDEVEDADLSSALGRIIDAAKRNPEVTDYAIKKGAELFGSLLKRLR
jgi:hypothetical protein